MVEPDPWNVIDKNQEINQNCGTGNLSNGTNIVPTAFEDNFLPFAGNTNENLPDSKEYIQALGMLKTKHFQLSIL